MDEYQNTRVPNIHSLGDCCGKWELTPVAIAARFRSFILRHLSRFCKIHPIIAHICRSSSPVSQSDTEFDLLSPAKISRIWSEPLFLTAEGVLRPGNTLSLSSKLSTPNFTNDPGIFWKFGLPFALLLPRDGWYARPASDSVSSSWVTLVGCCQVFAHQLEVSYLPNFQNLEVHPWWQKNRCLISSRAAPIIGP